MIRHEAPYEHGTVARATFSDDMRYRYTLERHWEIDRPKPLIMNFLMLNPSTADAFVLDPTVSRCVKRARSHGATGIIVTNLFALRATDPKDMRAAEDPIGEDNDKAIVETAQMADLIVCAWGTHGIYLDRDYDVCKMLEHFKDKCYRIGPHTKDGHPKHPLYLSDSLILERMWIR